MLFGCFFFQESPEPWSAKAFKHNWVRWSQCLSSTHDFSKIWKVLKGSNIFPWYPFRAADTPQGTWIMSYFLHEKKNKILWCWSAHSGALELEEAGDFVTQVIIDIGGSSDWDYSLGKLLRIYMVDAGLKFTTNVATSDLVLQVNQVIRFLLSVFFC